MNRIVRRLLKISAVAVTTVALLILVVLPVTAAALGPALLRGAGLSSQQLSVKMNTGLALLGGVVDQVQISSGPLDVAGRFHSADASIDLVGANLGNNTFSSLVVDASEPVATMASGEVVSARSLHAQGPADALIATARFSTADIAGILALPVVAARVGFQTVSVTLTDGAVLISTPTQSFEARLSVDASGRLWLARDGVAPALIWAATGPDAADWQLTSVTIDKDGVTATARFDGTAFLARYPNLFGLLGGFVPSK
jgi:hypothetical protein